MGGSQLAQLKAALRQSGLQRNNSTGSNKKRKTSSAAESKRTDLEYRNRKLAEIGSELNQFDVKVTKQKHEVLGRKIKGALGRPAVSRQVGIENRKKTLLPELQSRGRAGTVIDRRFGEDNPHLTPEEKAMERFKLESQRRAERSGRGSGFNIEEEDDSLTHYGQSLSTAFADEQGLPPAGEEDQDRRKTKAEVMQEVIAKSKMYKSERQAAKEDDDDARIELDGQLDDLRGLLGLTKRAPPDSAAEATLPDGSDEDEDESDTASSVAEDEIEGSQLKSSSDTIDELKRLLNLDASDEDERPLIKNTTGTSSNAVPISKKRKHGDDEDEYDRYVRELAFEKRAKPSNRLKTEEEKALEAKEALEKAEAARLRRMQGLPDIDQQSGGASTKRAPQADDLSDDDDFGLGHGLASAHAAIDEGETAHPITGKDAFDPESASDDDSASRQDEGLSIDGLLSDDEFAREEGPEAALVATKSPSERILQVSSSDAQRVPFSFELPASHDELMEIIEDPSAEEIDLVASRARTLYHPSLNKDNPLRLQVFLGVLIDHVLYSAAREPPDYASIDILTPHIAALCKAYAQTGASFFISKLALMQKNLVRGLQTGPLVLSAKTWPGSAELTLLRLIAAIWSTSDLSHPVGAPALLYICQVLSQCRVRSIKDLAMGLALSCTALQYESFSKRVIPEVVNFLLYALAILSPAAYSQLSVPGSFPALDIDSLNVKALAVPSTGLPERLSDGLDASRLLQSSCKFTVRDQTDLLASVSSVIVSCMLQCVDNPAFVELFGSAQALLEQAAAELPSGALKTRVEESSSAVGRMLKHAAADRRPLRLQSHKPIPIPSHIPKFEEGGGGTRAFDPDSARAAESKFKALYKKERKGAIRELRKDNRFIAGEKAKIKASKDDAYRSKIAKITAGLQDERAEEKAFERTKKREKRRDKARQ
ncbi:uncharacterized protein L969DRAFT_91325 [Mixia osmundae IAM 14324]|uniref:Nop14-like protein n=1 Tax=Mixia osmundae (strain CBS 9802 / IAM 14324 / JCM 22182 / KY 12970) TaxID=764103 RepID=G7E4L6_MIXOS|nr:uncharacterized protein L969DRAFT_91325 [Mixia osmundae IAM 14324]KEI41844.1 hypothetical protein L969DRAFT_91325 [Mixia osmundae IAM 14324]GAA97776.1 hypothetical protein E5Q_04455 [Mixia osmundae IAM 14324]